MARGNPAGDTARPEPPLRYTMAGGRVGVPDPAAWVRTRAELTFWLGIATLPARLLWRIGARRASSWMQRQWAHAVARVLDLHIDWQGLEHITPGETYLVTPLHEGFADALALLQLPLSLRFVARENIDDWRLLRACLRDTGQVIIPPEDGISAYRRMLREAQRVFASGESLVIFPQGTILGIEADFRPGAFALAHTLQQPILPVALTGSHRVWEYPYGARLRRGERVSVRVLPPIPADAVRTHSIDQLRSEVQCRLKTAALDRTMTPPRRFVPARDGYWDGFAYEIDPAFPQLAADVAAHRATRTAADQQQR